MYLIDSDVLIDAKNRHYGFDFVPAFWDWIAQQHRAGRVFTVQKVADEVLAGADELAQWMRIQPDSFRIAAGSNDQASLRAVAQWATDGHFTQGAVSDFLHKADYYLVGQAATLVYTVVTQETSDSTSKKRVKIPDACSAVGFSFIAPFNILRAEKARSFSRSEELLVKVAEDGLWCTASDRSRHRMLWSRSMHGRFKIE